MVVEEVKEEGEEPVAGNGIRYSDEESDATADDDIAADPDYSVESEFPPIEDPNTINESIIYEAENWNSAITIEKSSFEAGKYLISTDKSVFSKSIVNLENPDENIMQPNNPIECYMDDGKAHMLFHETLAKGGKILLVNGVYILVEDEIQVFNLNEKVREVAEECEEVLDEAEFEPEFVKAVLEAVGSQEDEEIDQLEPEFIQSVEEAVNSGENVFQNSAAAATVVPETDKDEALNEEMHAEALLEQETGDHDAKCKVSSGKCGKILDRKFPFLNS